MVYTAYDRAGTLTYYYDDQADARAQAGYVTELYDPENNPGALRFKTYHDQITKVVIDKSMKDKSLSSLAYMFFCGYETDGSQYYDLSNLIEISGMENLYTGSAMSMHRMFRGCSSLKSIDLSHFDTKYVRDMYGMFVECSSLTSLDLSTFNTAEVTDMKSMFQGCSSLTSLDVRPLYTANVKDMSYMFLHCYSLTSLDLSSFNTDNVTNTTGMFGSCKALVTILCDEDWSKSTNLKASDDMFDGCTSLVGEKGTQCDGKNNIGIAYARPDGGESKPGYFTKKKYEKEVYTSFDEKTATLTYYCDNLYTDRKESGQIVEIYDLVNAPNRARFADYYSKVKKAVIDESMKDTLLTSMWRMFYGGDSYRRLSSLQEISGLENLNTANVTSMSSMFEGCESLKSLDLHSFNTANVTNMSNMFYMCESLKSVDLSSFNTANVTNMKGMFAWCSSLTALILSSFTTANVTNMQNMFCRCESLKSLDIRTFNTANVTNMNSMFGSCRSLEFIYCNEDWSTSSVLTDSENMFVNCASLWSDEVIYDGNKTDATYARPAGIGGKPGYFTAVYEAYTVFDEGTGTLTYYYDKERSTHGGITEFCPLEWGEDIAHFAGYADQVKKAVIDPSFKDAPITTVSGLFNGGSEDTYLSALESIEGLENINYLDVTSLHNMFLGCSSLKELDLTFLRDAENVEVVENMFDGCSSLTSLDLRFINTSKVTSMYRMFADCSALEKIDLFALNTANVTSMVAMFEGCSSLKKLDLSSFNTAKVGTMMSMFSGCSSLTSLDLRSFNTEKVEYTTYMFDGCSSLKSLDLREFNIASLKNAEYMFNGCTSLTTIYCFDDWSVSTVLGDADNMFKGCAWLAGGNGTTCDGNSNIGKSYAHPDLGTGRPGYFTTVMEVYTAFDATTGTLTYYCDEERLNRTDVVTELYDPYDYKTVRFKEYHNDVLEVVIDESMKKANLTSMANMFFGRGEYDENSVYVRYPLANLKEIEGLDYLVTINVTDMSGMFYGCESVRELDLLNFNTVNVTDMSYMFSGCSRLRVIHSNEAWSSNVNLTNSENMFNGCSLLIGGNNTMCDGINDIDKTLARPDGVGGYDGYFTSAMQCYTVFDASTSTLTYYYDNEQSLREGTVELYTPKKGHNLVRFVGYADQIKRVVFDLSMSDARLTSLANLFNGGTESLSALNEIVGLRRINFCTVTDMFGMFRNCSALEELDATEISTSRVKNMSSMFYGCTSLKELDLTYFDVSKVKKMKSMFGNCTSLKTIRADKDWSAVNAESDNMFLNCRSLVGRGGTQCDGATNIDLTYARPDGGESQPGYFIQSVQPVKRGGFVIDDDGTIVEFAPGNLQFNAAKGTHLCADGTTQKGTWRFAPHQWTRAGKNNENIAEDYDGWIDLFGWGTSGWNSGATAYQPWSANSSYADYLNEHLEWENKYADWGVYNQIGDDAPDTWRTLTASEWNYIMTERPYAGNLRGQATVNGVHGFILLPDTWKAPDCISFEWGNDIGWNENVYDGEVWDKMEAAGAIFFPAAGYRDGHTLFSEDIIGYYWSTVKSNISQAYYFFFQSNAASRSAGSYNSYGRSVRLVKPYVYEPGISSDYQTPQDTKMTVTITADEGAAIWYKAFISDKMYDGTDPYDQDWQAYTDPFEVTPGTDYGETKYVTVLAYCKTEDTEKWGEVIKGQTSGVAVAEYVFSLPRIPEKPVISTDYTSTLDESMLVTITAEEDTKIRYKVIITEYEPATEAESAAVPWKKYQGAFYVFPVDDANQIKYVTIKAYASGERNSEIAEEEFLFIRAAQPEEPVISSDYEGEGSSSVTLTLTSEEGAKIWYKVVISGEEDDETGEAWKEYTGPVTVTPELDYGETKTVTILTYSDKSRVQSDLVVETFVFTKPEQPEKPVITSDYAGEESESVTVTVTAAEGATVYYAVLPLSYDENGKLIDTEDYSKAEFKKYEDAVKIVPEGEEYTKAAYKIVTYAEKDGVQSEYATETFEFLLPELLDAPVISSDYSGPKDESITVTVTSEEGAKIWYKVLISDEKDGVDPDAQEWKEYTAQLTVTPEVDFGKSKYVTVLAYAEKNGTQSETAKEEYIFSKPAKPAKPTITSDYNDQLDEKITVTVDAGEFDSWYKVIISDQPYDGNDEEKWTKYTGPFTVTPEVQPGETKYVTILTYADNDGVASEIAKEEYIFSQPEPIVCPEFEFVDSNGDPIGESFYLMLGEPFVAPTLKLLTEGTKYTVTYSSSNEEVATIDADGNVQIVGVGEAVIIADVTVEGISKDDCSFGYLTYTIQVDEPEDLEPMPADKETTIDFAVFDPTKEEGELLGITLGAKDEYNAEEGRVEISSTSTVEEIDEKLNDAFDGIASVKDFLPGTIVLKLDKGEGTIEIDCQTMPGFVLKVRIAEYGEAYITSTIEQALRGEATVNYSVSQKTYVVIYLESTTSGAKTQARIARSEKEEGAGAYVYAIKITPKNAATGIDNVEPSETIIQKQLINGVLYIERNGQRYDATGRDLGKHGSK